MPQRFLAGSLTLTIHRLLCLICVIIGAALLTAFVPPAGAEVPIELNIVGGLAGVRQYEIHEERFWTQKVRTLTNGRVQAQIVPFDRSGLRGQEMLQLLRLGIVPFGDVLLALAAADEPEINAVDLPLLNPDFAALRRTVTLWRPRLTEILHQRYGLKLLTVYTYPAQVVFCRPAFGGLFDLKGKRVRTSSVGQSELITALGGAPVVIPFAEILQAVRTGVVDCAITGAQSGNQIGLQNVATHVSRFGISWGVSVFAANEAAWEALPADIRAELERGLEQLQEDIWADAERETQQGIDCNAGRASCRDGRPGQMTVVDEDLSDNTRWRALLTSTVVPNWVRRCGPECAATWNHAMSPTLGITAEHR